MTSNRKPNAEQIFYQALEQSEPERSAFIDSACRGDESLRAEVDALLGADADSARFLQSPFGNAHVAQKEQTTSDPLIGQHVGQFQILRRIAAGGMGAVYEAHQEKPKRIVAVKVMHSGAFSESALRRFEQEEQVLARLRHPNIAQIYDAGTYQTALGPVPFFAMEYLEAATNITNYSQEQNLSHRQKLEIFLSVCEAVQHGHQRGVIHRDLKPANILVVAPGIPKVIDFGVARMIDADGTIATRQSLSGQLVGTLRYMSPEQSAGDMADIDTRSDVYALGVVLFELLTGQLPYDMTTPSPYDIPRIIREVEAERIASIDPSLKGDLEVITLKALEKDRQRRYQSVADLGRDIQHFLNHEPIEARRDSTWYVLQKTLARHKGAVLVAGLFMLLITGSAIALGLLYRDANAQRVLAQENLKRSMEAEARAATEATTANQSLDFLVSLFSVSDPFAVPELSSRVGTDISAREVLDRGVERIDQDLSEEPEAQSALLIALGNVFDSLGDYQKAETLLRRAVDVCRSALGPEHPATAKAQRNLGRLLVTQGKYAAAEKQILTALDELRRSLAPDDLEIAQTLATLGFLRYAQNDGKGSEGAFREALAIQTKHLDKNHREIADSLNGIGLALHAQQQNNEAQPLFEESLRIKRKIYGSLHAEVAISLNNLAGLLRSKGDIAGAEQKYRESLAIKRQLMGNNHPTVSYTLNNLAALLHDQRDFEQAEKLYRESLDIRQRFFGEKHEAVAQVRNNLGELMMQSGRIDEAESYFRQALAIRQAMLGEEASETLRSFVNLGWYYRMKGDLEAAEPYYVTTLEKRSRILGDNHPHTILVRKQLEALRKERQQTN